MDGVTFGFLESIDWVHKRWGKQSAKIRCWYVGDEDNAAYFKDKSKALWYLDTHPREVQE